MPGADSSLEAAIAATRFGLGARPGEIAAAAHDPRGFLKAQIRAAGADQPQANGETSAQRITQVRQYTLDWAQARKAAMADSPEQIAAMKAAHQRLRAATDGDILARFRLAAESDAGFRERWALFFANHFSVSAVNATTGSAIGPFEAEAIRPHVFGRFADLLVAVEQHPAMLLYLDQSASIGPNSLAAQRAPSGRRAGLNENLAREILELHTVGVDGGYTQTDVTEFARALTGLSIARENTPQPGGVTFRAIAHEPGPRTVMGVRYGPGGREQSSAILRDLAARPQTARFVCRKIARHFVSDDPPRALVGRLTAAWTRSDGDLSQVAEALIEAPEAWEPTPRKIKTPYEFLVSSYRAAGASPEGVGKVAPVLNGLGQKPFVAPSPEGWPDEAGPWVAGGAVVRRMQFAQTFAAAHARGREPVAFAHDALGARLTPVTERVVARAETRAEGLALLLMSPEFQRR